MLTYEAMGDRQWGWIPALRAVLQDMPDPDPGLTSIDYQAGEYVHQLLLVAEIALAHPAELRAASTAESAEALEEDIRRVVSALEGFAAHLHRTSRAVAELRGVIRQGYDDALAPGS